MNPYERREQQSNNNLNYPMNPYERREPQNNNSLNYPINPNDRPHIPYWSSIDLSMKFTYHCTSLRVNTRTYPSAPEIANIESSCEKSTLDIYLGML